MSQTTLLQHIKRFFVMSNKRNTTLDLMRWLCAFLVVVIHVPIYGKGILMPFTRIAVPFFYMVTGYYIYTSNEDKLKGRLLMSSKKWGGNWFVFTFILLAIKMLIEWNSGRISSITSHDIYQTLISGYCKYLDVVSTKDQSFGISTLWFLYCGTIAMMAMFFIHKRLFHKSVIICISVFSFVILVAIYICDNHVVSRVLYQAFPFLFLGMLVHRYEKTICKTILWKSKYLFAAITLFIITLYVERIVTGSVKEIYLSTPLLVTAIFITCLKYPDVTIRPLSSLPVKATLDIYVWHRLIYALITAYIFDFGKMSGIVIFLICVVLFFHTRYMCKK